MKHILNELQDFAESEFYKGKRKTTWEINEEQVCLLKKEYTDGKGYSFLPKWIETDFYIEKGNMSSKLESIRIYIKVKK
jgi:phage pi2 protein 07